MNPSLPIFIGIPKGKEAKPNVLRGPSFSTPVKMVAGVVKKEFFFLPKSFF